MLRAMLLTPPVSSPLSPTPPSPSRSLLPLPVCLLAVILLACTVATSNPVSSALSPSPPTPSPIALLSPIQNTPSLTVEDGHLADPVGVNDGPDAEAATHQGARQSHRSSTRAAWALFPRSPSLCQACPGPLPPAPSLRPSPPVKEVKLESCGSVYPFAVAARTGKIIVTMSISISISTVLATPTPTPTPYSH
eukprot:scaffold92096_cov34-Tisochrysis_lutea.AAC.2